LVSTETNQPYLRSRQFLKAATKFSYNLEAAEFHSQEKQNFNYKNPTEFQSQAAEYQSRKPQRILISKATNSQINSQQDFSKPTGFLQ